MAVSDPHAKLGEYAVIRNVGEGAFGKVKLAVHTATGARVALKYISKTRINRMKMKMRVTREIEYLRVLRHPHIIKLYEVINTDTDIIMVIEYAGGELFNYIVENGRMSESVGRRFFQQIMYAVSYSHALRIVHRDLKPENVLLDQDLNVKIADFGLSNEITDGDFLRTSCGSPNYAAPEVISGKLYAGPEIDVWSCGVILYVMLCGRLPFEDEHVPALFKKISNGSYHMPSYLSYDVKTLISAMLAVDPVKRYTVAEVLAHPWVNEGLPSYLRPLQPSINPILNDLSSLVQSQLEVCEILPGIGKLDDDVVQELVEILDADNEAILRALRKEGENSIKVAYRLCKDRCVLAANLPPELSDDQFRPSTSTRPPLEPVWIPVNAPMAQIAGIRPRLDEADSVFEDDNDEYDEYDDEYYEDEDEYEPSEEHGFAVLGTSLVGNPTPILPLLPQPEVLTNGHEPSPYHHPQPDKYGRPRNHHRHTEPNNYHGSRLISSNGPMPIYSPASNAQSTSNSNKGPKWHYGIRSRSPPMEVMLEIYNTLRTLGMEWKEKGGVWGRYVPTANGHTNGASEHEGDPDGEGEGLDERENGDIYFVQTRWRVRDVVVRMDLQLYQVAPGSYLVDFRNVGAYNASTSPTAASPFERAPFPYTPSSTPSFTSPLSPFSPPFAEVPSYASTPFSSPLAERPEFKGFTPIKHSASLGAVPNGTMSPIERLYSESCKKEVDVFSPFLFLECACRLIVELAGAS